MEGEFWLGWGSHRLPCPSSPTPMAQRQETGELLEEKARARARADCVCCAAWSPGYKVFSIPLNGRSQAPRDDSCKLLILQMRHAEGQPRPETGLRSKAKCTLPRSALSLGSRRGRRRGCDPEEEPPGAVRLASELRRAAGRGGAPTLTKPAPQNTAHWRVSGGSDLRNRRWPGPPPLPSAQAARGVWG